MTSKNDKIISAILRSSKPEASEADLKIGMVNIKLTAELDTSVHVTHISNFLSVPKDKTEDANFTKRHRILVCFFSDSDKAKVTKFNATLKDLTDLTDLTDFEPKQFKENIYIYSNKKETLEVKAVDKSFTVDGHTIYINDKEAESEVDYNKMENGNIILNNNTDTAPTLPTDSLKITLENAPSPDGTVTDKLKEMGYDDTIFPIYEVREESKTAPFLTKLCVEDLAVGAVGEAETGGSKKAAMKGADQYPVPGISSLEGASGGREYAAEGKAAEAAKAAAKKEAEAAKAAKKGGSRSKRNRKRSRGGGRKRKNKRSKKRKYMRSKKRKKLQRR